MLELVHNRKAVAMPAPGKFVDQAFTADVAIVNAAETVLATLLNVNTQTADAPVRLRGWAQITLGATPTNVILRIRRGGIAGAIVGEGNPIVQGVVAANTIDDEVQGDDVPGEVTSQSYVLTGQVTGGSSNSTALAGRLEAFIG